MDGKSGLATFNCTVNELKLMDKTILKTIRATFNCTVNELKPLSNWAKMSFSTLLIAQ